MQSNSNIDNIDISPFYKYLERNKMDVKDYQVHGVKWALDKEINGTQFIDNKETVIVKGGIIADEMGLGKTIQTIGIILSNLKRHTLIVLPLILVQQWYDIIYKTIGHHALIYHGQDKKKITFEKIKKAPIVLTTYGTIANRANSAIYRIDWDRVIFDEAHHIKNKNTNAYMATLIIKTQVKWMVTGTPIQNNKKDLQNIANSIGVPYQVTYNEIEKVNSIIIRRTKAQLGIKIATLNIHTNTVEWNNKKEKEMALQVHTSQESPLIRTIRAKQMCIYPHLIQNVYSQYFDQNTQYQSKIQNVSQTIINNKNGNKKIVFCQFKREIEIIYSILTHANINTKIIDGSTTLYKRNEILNDNQVNTIILQIQTACEGLNLQQFNEIYFVSPHWNPAVEDQAIARCHRIGQKKDVEVYKFIMDYTQKPITEEDYHTFASMDLRCNNTQDFKRNIANEILK